MNCKTCEFWKDPENDAIGKDICFPIDIDTDEEMVMPFQVKRCNNPKICYFERTPFSDGFSLSDASGYFANMYTGEDFGCVHHKLRTVEYLFGVDHAIR